jgi:hypothetical protein
VAAVHLVPIRVSVSGEVPPAMVILPTATQAVAVAHDTPDSDPSDPPPGMGPVEAVHVVPASDSISGKYR